MSYRSGKECFRHTPKVGNIYPAKGGGSYHRSTQKWIVVSIVGDADKDLLSAKCVMLGLDVDNNVCSSQTYNAFALSDRELLGWCDVTQLRFEP